MLSHRNTSAILFLLFIFLSRISSSHVDGDSVSISYTVSIYLIFSLVFKHLPFINIFQCPANFSACNCTNDGNFSQFFSCDGKVMAPDLAEPSFCCNQTMTIEPNTNETCCANPDGCMLCTMLLNCSLTPCWQCHNSSLHLCPDNDTTSTPTTTSTNIPTVSVTSPTCGFLGIVSPEPEANGTLLICKDNTLAYVCDSLICVGIPVLFIIIITVSIVCYKSRRGKCGQCRQCGLCEQCGPCGQCGGRRRDSEDSIPMDLKHPPSVSYILHSHIGKKLDSSSIYSST